MKKLLTVLLIFTITIGYSQTKTYEYVALVNTASSYDNPVLTNIENDRTVFYMSDSVIYYSSRVNPLTAINSPSTIKLVDNKYMRYYEVDGLLVVYDDYKDCIYFMFTDGTTYIFFN